MEKFLGPKDVAGVLGISERGAVRLMEQGKLKSMRAGVKKWRTTKLHFESYVAQEFENERLRHEAPAPPSAGLVIRPLRPRLVKKKLA